MYSPVDNRVHLLFPQKHCIPGYKKIKNGETSETSETSERITLNTIHLFFKKEFLFRIFFCNFDKDNIFAKWGQVDEGESLIQNRG